MTTTNQEQQIKNQILMFGVTQAELEENAMRTIEFKVGGVSNLVMSILSDVQEMIERDHKELARQSINQAKYLLAKGPELEEKASKRNEIGVKSDVEQLLETGVWTNPNS